MWDATNEIITELFWLKILWNHLHKFIYYLGIIMCLPQDLAIELATQNIDFDFLWAWVGS